MGRRELSETVTEVTRIQGGSAPPVIPELFSGDTRMTGRWWNEPFDCHVPGMTDHVLVAKYAGDGESMAKVDGKVLADPWRPAAFALVPRGHDGDWRLDGPVQTSNIFLGHARVRSCAEQVASGREPELIDRMNFCDPKVFSIMSLLSQEAESREPMQRLFVEHLLDLLCLQLLRAHSSFAEKLPLGPQRGLAVWQVKRVTSYMRERLAQDIGLQELADLLNLSRFHFCTAFRMATGHTPHEWLTQQRIALARVMIADPTLRITDVALAVGYHTPSAFAASFRKIVGVTPTEFRRNL
jgi:AraC family transcriptional regulator